MNYEFPSPGSVKADIRIAGGTLTVDAGDHDVITVSVEPDDHSSASQEAADQTRVSLEGKQLVVHAPHGKGWAVFRWPKLNIKVTIPNESTLTVKSASADVTCTGTYKDAVGHTASGDMSIDRVLKDASVNSASGNVRLAWVGGDLRVNSASGDITAQYAGKDVDLHSASGDIEIGRADGDVKAKTASGDVEVGVARQGEVRVHTASGDVSVGVAAGTGVWLDLSTASGKTTSDLSISGPDVPPTGAALKIKIRTASGDITLRRMAGV